MAKRDLSLITGKHVCNSPSEFYRKAIKIAGLIILVIMISIGIASPAAQEVSQSGSSFPTSSERSLTPVTAS